MKLGQRKLPASPSSVKIARYTEAARSYEKSEASCNGIGDWGDAVGRDDGNVDSEGEQQQPSAEGAREGQRAKQATAEQQQQQEQQSQRPRLISLAIPGENTRFFRGLLFMIR